MTKADWIEASGLKRVESLLRRDDKSRVGSVTNQISLSPDTITFATLKNH
jgi:hypothetical protein